MRKTRRAFLKAALASVTLCSSAWRSRGWANTDHASTGVRMWSTFRDIRHREVKSPIWKPITQYAPDAIVLDPESTRQEILGFGAALTDSACYVLSRMSESQRRSLMYELFAPDEMSLNVCQTCMGASDYSKTLYGFDEGDHPDPELKRFTIEHDRDYILPILREARANNPDLFLFSTPWSPPGWMKSGGSLLGGVMLKRFYRPYAQYFVRFLNEYEKEGVSINAVSVQNELDTDQDGQMPACIWGQEYEIQFVKDHLGPMLHDANKEIKIWILSHNYNLWGRAIGELSDPEANKYIDGVAWHGYSGEPSAMRKVHDAFPQKSAYWTEGGPDITAPDYLTDWSKWSSTFNGILRNWSRSITAWNLALDEKGNPKIGPFPCGGVVTVENGTNSIRRSGQYWALAHLSRHVRRGARVFRSNGIGEDDGEGSGISHVAFTNADGSHVMVIANSGPETHAQLIMRTNAIDVELPADSVHTIVWS